MRDSIKPQHIKSGTYFNQMQLRGSILVIKDNLNTESGYLAFGSSMSTIPTSPTTGTGIYIDYRGVYANASGVAQFYLQSSDGKAYAGAGGVVLDVNGINLPTGTGNTSSLKWYRASDSILTGVIYSSAPSTTSLVSVRGNSSGANTYGGVELVARDSGTGDAFMGVLADASGEYGFMFGDNGFIIGTGDSISAPSSLLHLVSTTPTFRMEDSTASAKSLQLKVDGDLAIFEEVGGDDVLKLDLAGRSVIMHSAAIATNATTGFLYITACAGVPTGTPTTYTGRVPIVADSTNNKLYIYSGGAWVALN
jgi:hypothetical protein